MAKALRISNDIIPSKQRAFDISSFLLALQTPPISLSTSNGTFWAYPIVEIEAGVYGLVCEPTDTITPQGNNEEHLKRLIPLCLPSATPAQVASITALFMGNTPVTMASLASVSGGTFVDLPDNTGGLP